MELENFSKLALQEGNCTFSTPISGVISYNPTYN